jgi:N-acetylglucosaminyldiphosphoundecaprenol N-acetyl-beta-D-mannosaminyltransferase
MNRDACHEVWPSADQIVNILGTPVAALDRESLTDAFEKILASGARGWISNANIHAMNLAASLPWFMDFQQTSLFNFCDGEGVRLGARLLGHRIPERIPLTDWIYDVCRVAAQQGSGIFLLGAKDGVATIAALRLKEQIPGVVISGTHHGYFGNEETMKIVDSINASGAHILIVGMGMPIQEAWILAHRERLSPRIMMNAGSCFDYVAGTRRRCPNGIGMDISVVPGAHTLVETVFDW